MVPGAFGKVIQCLSAKPDRGRTCTSNPSGIAIRRPVGTKARAPGSRTTVPRFGKFARRSAPAAPALAYVGKPKDLSAPSSQVSSIVTTPCPSSFFKYARWPDLAVRPARRQSVLPIDAQRRLCPCAARYPNRCQKSVSPHFPIHP